MLNYFSFFNKQQFAYQEVIWGFTQGRVNGQGVYILMEEGMKHQTSDLFVDFNKALDY